MLYKKAITGSAVLALSAAAMLMSGCEVTNPGTVQDAFRNRRRRVRDSGARTARPCIARG